MKRTSWSILAIFLLLSRGISVSAQTNDSLQIRRLFDEALLHGTSYQNLNYLCKQIGGRLAGSPNATKAVEYVYKLAQELKTDTCFKQACLVPHWIRGDKEEAKIWVNGKATPVSVCALGSSIGTGEKGIRAKVVEVRSKDELAKLGKEKLGGKIIFFNQAMDPKLINTMVAYGGTSHQRAAAAVRAAPYGAVGAVVRSLSLAKQDFPHTGNMYYSDTIPKIPACAISTNGADLLSDLLKTNPDLEFYFKQNCQSLPEENSHNVIAEIKGKESPNEYIVVAGHLDSWDLGEGAHDDGAGVMQSLEVLRILKAINYTPKHSIRAIAYMNEENGVRGGKKYAEEMKTNKVTHIAAIESDCGAFAPRGFYTTGNQEVRNKLYAWKSLLEPYGIHDFSLKDSGTDIKPLEASGTVGFALITESQRYFDYHHSEADTYEKINKREMELGAAAMAALVYLIDQYGVK